MNKFFFTDIKTPILDTQISIEKATTELVQDSSWYTLREDVREHSSYPVWRMTRWQTQRVTLKHLKEEIECL